MAIMNRQQAKDLLPIIQAFAEGKTIQVQEDIDWCYLGDEIDFNFSPQRYRIKPEPKYRPFANADECWQEMQKHQPLGWIKYKETKYLITEVSSMCITVSKNYYFKEANEVFTFVDGTPFGIKEEE